MNRKKSKTKGTLVKKVVLKRTGGEPRVLHEEEENEEIESDAEPGDSVCWTYATAGITRSANYQSVTLTIGGEMPWKCAPGDTKTFLRSLKAFESIIEKRAADKIDEMDELLKELAE